MKLWELINPSDPITFEADTLEIAAAVVGFLGSHYGAKEIDGDLEVPVFSLGGLSEWLANLYGRAPDEFVRENCEAIADALDSVCVGGSIGRELYNERKTTLPRDAFETWRVEFDDKHRSSMNNIESWCWQTAKEIRPSGGEEGAKP